MSAATPLLSVEDLKVSFRTEEGLVHAVDGVSFTVDPGEVVAIVGESGSGKSVTSMTLMGLTRSPNAFFEGSAHFEGIELIRASNDQLRRIRGARIAMIFQDPISSVPSKCAVPPNDALGDRVSPISIIDVTDLPDPDSPTIATTSPGSTLKETPSTACTRPSSVRKLTRRSSTESSGPVELTPTAVPWDRAPHGRCRRPLRAARRRRRRTS